MGREGIAVVSAFRRTPLALCTVVLLTLSGGHVTLARQDPQQPLFRSGTELVQVDAIVQTGDGQFVSGLNADDFELFEDGKSQPIQLFYLVTGPSAVVPRAKVAEGIPRLPDQTARRLFTIIFDQDHLNFDSFKRVQKAAVAFLQEHFRPGDVGGVVVEGGMANGRLTTVRGELIDVVQKAKPRTDVRERFLVFREWPRLESEFEALRIDAGDIRMLNEAVTRNCLERPEECARPGVTEQVENQLQWNARQYLAEARAAASRLIQTLSAITTGLGRMEGRKTVVLLSEGFLVEDSRGVLSQIAARAARFGVTIYGIDARGLSRVSTGATDASQPGARMSPAIFDTSEDGPYILAVDTGGFVVHNSNDFLGALNRIADDTSTYYVLGYPAGSTTLDGKFRKIDVRVKWKGMKVRARKGYLATAIPPPARMRATRPGGNAAPQAPPTAADQAPASLAPFLPATEPSVAPAAPPATPFILVSDMLVRPEPDTPVRELLALDPKANASTDAPRDHRQPERPASRETATRSTWPSAGRTTPKPAPRSPRSTGRNDVRCV